MTSTLVFTIIGPDRPGLVEQVAAVVATRGGNWLESRLCHLGGQFAGIVRVEIEADQAASLRVALAGVSGQALKVVVHEGEESSDEEGVAASATPGTRVVFEVVGHDRPGIVRKIAQALASQGVNVEDLATERTSAPMSGERLFQARAEVLIPPEVDAASVRAALEEIASDLLVDLEFL